jgi:trans-aconitate 2-methyltransferase
MTTEEEPVAAPADQSDPVPRVSYAFGDVEAAASRLQLLHRVFAQPSQLLVDVAGSIPIGLAVDLGCGPGFTTRLLADRLRPKRLVGLDASEAFLEQATTALPSAEFVRHDVTEVPFPTGPSDLLHARFVLSHLPQPERVLASWLTQLKPGGYLLIQEDEEIVADHSVLAAYEEMARSLVAHRGGDLWVGARLADAEPPHGYQTTLNRLYSHRIPVALAAQLFSMNFAIWRNDPFIVESYSPSLLEELALELARTARTADRGQVVFDLRLLAYRPR